MTPTEKLGNARTVTLDTVTVTALQWHTSIANETFHMAKKPPAKKDWTPEYIKYRIRSKFASMSALAVLCGLHPTVIRRTLRVPYPKVERVIAEALGTTPADIWPSRYDPELLRTNWRLWRRLSNVNSSTAAASPLVENDQAD